MPCMQYNSANLPPAAGTAELPNGVLVPPVTGQPPNGLNMKSVLDGTSKTIIACETKEQVFSSWYDGTVAWTVGYVGPNQIGPVTLVALVAKSATTSGLYWQVAPGMSTALNAGPRAATPTYCFNSSPGGGSPAFTGVWQWGPSSDHSGGVVIHLACDASVHSITEDIDGSLYLQLITRAGGEPVTLPDVGG
jgi:uncharacterized protein DUF1559